ncbi:MAG: cyclic nucleotide-binding domain-containing protein [Myxococcales bacterium]|nr:cyclic nucleotide-binding domain-containing protein [Myxococcales bacterium]
MRVKASSGFGAAGAASADEDAFAVLEQPWMAAVADGMGGRGAGDIASALAMDKVRQKAGVLERLVQATHGDRSSGARLAIGRTLERLFQEVHTDVADAARIGARPGMGTTLGVVVIAAGTAHVAHLGAVRAYLWRAGSLRPLTEDHTLGMIRVKQGLMTAEEYRRSPLRTRLFVALGGTNDLDVEVRSIDIANGDRILLCTDGVHGMLDDDTIASVLQRQGVNEAAEALVEAARAAGSQDDATAVVLEVAADRAADEVDQVSSGLAATALFRDVAATDRMLVAPYLDERPLRAAEVLFREGEPGDSFYVVASGRLKIVRGGTPLVEVGPGGSFGELTLARDVPRSATVYAVEDTLVYGLTRDRFREVVDRRPAVGTRLLLAALDGVGDRLREVSERLSQVEKLAVGEIKPGDHALRTAIVLAARGEWEPPTSR